MFDQAMRTPQAGGAHDQLQPRSEGKGLLPAAMHLEGEHSPKIPHLSAGNLVPRIAGQARIVDNRNGRVSGQEFRHPAGILAMQAHAGNQRLQPTQNEPAVKWR